MKRLFLMLIILPAFAKADFSDWFGGYGLSDTPFFRIQASTGISYMDPTDMEAFRDHFKWEGRTSTTGGFRQFVNSDVGVGFLLGPGHLMFHYYKGGQDLDNTSIDGATYSIQDKFEYAAKYIMYDIPFQDEEWFYSIGFGIGKAEKFNFHQVGSWGDDIVWSGTPVGYRARASIGYTYEQIVGVYFEAGYEMMKSQLKASADYGNVRFGTRSIQEGDSLEDPRTDKEVEMDISGARLGFGIIVMF